MPSRGPDLVDLIGFDESQDWQAQTGPMIDAIMGAADLATSFDEFLATLTQLYGTLPTAELQRRLALATTKARGLGEATDDV